MNYFGKRYYDADIGYWTSCDPKQQFWSLYSYTGNGYNPIHGIDPNGEDFGVLLNRANVSHTSYMVGSQTDGGYIVYQGALNYDKDPATYLSFIGNQLTGGTWKAEYLIKDFTTFKVQDGKVIFYNGDEKLAIFDNASIFNTTAQQDKMISQNVVLQFIRTWVKGYSIFDWRCDASTVEAAAAGGINIKQGFIPAKTYENSIKSGGAPVINEEQ